MAFKSHDNKGRDQYSYSPDMFIDSSAPEDDPFDETIPALRLKIPIAPMAHRETQFTQQGHAVTDKEKRKYMIAVSGMLREFEGWFKGWRFIKLYALFAFERPGKECGIGQRRADWDNPKLSLYKSSTPDIDNCLKTLKDCLAYHVIDKGTAYKPKIMGAGIIDNDSCICSLESHKIYVKQDEDPYIIIRLSQVSNRFNKFSR